MKGPKTIDNGSRINITIIGILESFDKPKVWSEMPD